MPKVQKFKKITDKFVETGCYLGDGIQLALDSGFDEIFSIELAPKYIKFCEDRFVNKKINFIEGDSYTELSRLLNRFPVDKFTYWLDGHYSGNDTGRGVKDFPIMEELEVILRRDVSGEIIYVDDMRILKNYSDDINTEKIISLIEKYKSNYKISYEDSTLHSGEYLHNDIMVIEY
jgi:hypothetical protein